MRSYSLDEKLYTNDDLWIGGLLGVSCTTAYDGYGNARQGC